VGLPDRVPETIEEMLAWCRRGPALARVTTVDVTWEDYGGDLSGFRILR
jgi:acylphosphatase